MSSKGRVSGVVAALAAVAMTVVLVACGGSGAGGDGKPNGAPAAQYPSGLFMLEYLGDESGAYVADFNEYEDFLNRPITLLAMMWSMGDTIWCEVGVDGKGTFHAPDIDPVAMDFTAGGPDSFRYSNASPIAL